MGKNLIDSFREYREKMNEKLLARDNKVIGRIFHLDTHAYLDGAGPGILGGLGKIRQPGIG
jgi:hypothetical protein